MGFVQTLLCLLKQSVLQLFSLPPSIVRMKKFLLLLSLFVVPMECFIEMRSLTLETNKTLCDLYINFTNNAENDLVLNITIDTRKVLTKIIFYVRVCLPINSQDQRFQLEIMKTTMDGEKLINGVKTNFLSKTLMENYLKSIDYEPKFPFQKGIYRHINFTMNAQYVPFSPNTKFFMEVRTVGKVQAKKGLNFMANVKVYGMVRS